WRWRLYEQAEAAFRSADARGHLRAVGSLCDLLLERGFEAQALAVAHDSFDDRLRRLGPEHELTLFSRHLLAYSIGRAGAPQEAVRLYEELAADAVRLLGNAHELTRKVRMFPAQFTARTGHPQKAAKMYGELVTEWTHASGESDQDVLRARDQAALC